MGEDDRRFPLSAIDPPPLVLLSDDDARLSGALARLFKGYGMDCLMDVNSDVESLAERYNPALIILDLTQKIDGRTLLSRLKRNRRTRHIPVVVLSGIYHEQVRAYCLALGASEYAIKPFDLQFVARMSATSHYRTGNPVPP